MSASCTTTTSPVACSKPVRRAAPFPRFRSCRIRRSMSDPVNCREEVPRPVRRSVVDHDHLQPERYLPNASEQCLDGTHLIVDRDHDRQSNSIPREVVVGDAPPMSLGG